jgi:protein subunit release factor B
LSNRQAKRLIFSVTAKDCKFKATKGSGPGGQHRNKTSSAIYCFHEPSGAVGYACDERSQHRNKKIAFGRMARSKKFKDWLRLEVSRVTGERDLIEKKVDVQMKSENLKVEFVDENGRWVVG